MERFSKFYLTNSYKQDTADHKFHGWLDRQAKEAGIIPEHRLFKPSHKEIYSEHKVTYRTNDPEVFLDLLYRLYSGLRVRSNPHFWPDLYFHLTLLEKPQWSWFYRLEDIGMIIRALQNEITNPNSSYQQMGLAV